MKRAALNDWVEISSVILPSQSRSLTLPPETQSVDLVLRCRGFAETEAAVGEHITIKTFANRTISGTLESINPSFKHDFGNSMAVLLNTRQNLQQLMRHTV